jgi:hypothetical protein
MDSVTLSHSDQSGKVLADQTIAQRSGFSKDLGISSFGRRIPSSLFGSSFAFFVNGSVIESDIAEAVGLSLFVREQLSVDYCAREFSIFEPGFESSVISSFQSFF